MHAHTHTHTHTHTRVHACLRACMHTHVQAIAASPWRLHYVHVCLHACVSRNCPRSKAAMPSVMLVGAPGYACMCGGTRAYTHRPHRVLPCRRSSTPTDRTLRFRWRAGGKKFMYTHINIHILTHVHTYTGRCTGADSMFARSDACSDISPEVQFRLKAAQRLLTNRIIMDIAWATVKEKRRSLQPQLSIPSSDGGHGHAVPEHKKSDAQSDAHIPSPEGFNISDDEPQVPQTTAPRQVAPTAALGAVTPGAQATSSGTNSPSVTQPAPVVQGVGDWLMLKNRRKRFFEIIKITAIAGRLVAECESLPKKQACAQCQLVSAWTPRV